MKMVTCGSSQEATSNGMHHVMFYPSKHHRAAMRLIHRAYRLERHQGNRIEDVPNVACAASERWAV